MYYFRSLSRFVLNRWFKTDLRSLCVEGFEVGGGGGGGEGVWKHICRTLHQPFLCL